MKKKISAVLLVVALALSMVLVPALAVRADGGIPNVVWLPPLANQGEFQLKDGSTLPIKFTLQSDGSFVKDTGVQVDVNEILFRDDFNDGDFDEWMPVDNDASWSVDGGVLRCVPAITYPRILATNTLSYENYVFEADARLVSGRGYALLFRAANYNEFYSFQYQYGVGFQLRLYQFTNFPIGADVAPQVNYATDYGWHQLKVKVVGNNIKCYVDGNEVFNVTDTVDPAPLQGGVGFRTWASSQAEFDNVMVLGLSPAKTFPYGEGADNVRISYDTVFLDTFGSGDGTQSDYYPADPWTEIRGTWSIVSGQMQQTDYLTNDYNVAFYDTGTSWSDYILETTVTPVSGSGYQWAPFGFAGVVFRVQTPGTWGTGTFYYWLIGVTNDGSFGYSTLWHSPSKAALWGSGMMGYAPAGNTLIKGQPNPVKVVVRGSNPVVIELYLRDNLEATVTVSDATKWIPSGAIGLATYTSSTSFDDVKVQTPHYIANLHTKENGMSQRCYLITVWSGDGDRLGTYLFDLTDAIQGKGRGKGKV